jgi:hypothetical protein
MKPSGVQPFRVFISYSHADDQKFREVSAALERAGVKPWSDANLAAGTSFSEQIQTNISHSHLFVPILTEQSHARGWVHQEIGFAVAMKVPCVPICIGRVPEGMIALAHAVVVDEALSDLDAKLKAVPFGALVEDAAKKWVPCVAALEPEIRAEMITQYADNAHKKVGPGCVRVEGGLSSFSLPSETITHDSWKARYGDKPRSPFSLNLFRLERLALDRHAAVAGVRMIINSNLDLDSVYGTGATRTRLCLLTQSLESLRLPGDSVQIALAPELPPHLMLAVGDWFVAESFSAVPIRGVLHTAFTAHASAVSKRITDFDQRLATLLKEQGISPAQSKAKALERLRARIRDLPKHPAWSCEGDPSR